VSAVQILIRRIERDQKGNEALFEKTIDSGTLTMGHRFDQTLQLLDPEIAPCHAVLTLRRGGGFDLRTVGAARVQLADKTVARARLTAGQSIAMGRQTLTVVAPPPGFAAAIEVLALTPDEAFGPATHFVLELTQTGLRSRPLAWLLLLIPLLFLALPLAGVWQPALATWLRAQPWLPADSVWSSGPLSGAHSSPDIGSNCQACHLKLFEPAPDRGCGHCHEAINAHFDRRLVDSPLLDAMACARCHKEHNEPGNLLRHDSALCIDCHRELGAVAKSKGAAKLSAPVSGLALGSHPQFPFTLWRFDATRWTWSLSRLPSEAPPEPREGSNLRFSHALHLDPKKVQVPGTKTLLGCADCHRLGRDPEHFEPISMEGQCRRCHSLAFDEAEPEQQLPHADVPAAVRAIEEHFIRQFLLPGATDGSSQRNRRRPGQAVLADPCRESPLTCARERSRLEAFNQFSRSGCVTCHQVTEQPEQPLPTRWRVKPVRLVADWYPAARFNHVAHLAAGATAAERDKACSSCHAAKLSKVSADILIPGLTRCLDCHGDRASQAKVKLDCTGCHAFHQRSGTPLKPQSRLADPAAQKLSGVRQLAAAVFRDAGGDVGSQNSGSKQPHSKVSPAYEETRL